MKIYNEGSIVYNVTRTNTDGAPADNNCKEGFQIIISQCILEADYWGGSYFYNAFTYAIYNAIYRDNGLPSYHYTSTCGVPEDSSNGQTATTSPWDRRSTRSRAVEAPVSTFTPTPNEGSPSATPAQPSYTPAAIPRATIVTQTNSDGSAVVVTARSVLTLACTVYNADDISSSLPHFPSTPPYSQRLLSRRPPPSVVYRWPAL